MNRRAVRFLIAAILLLGLAGVAAARTLWLDVPFIRQEPEGCGAASLAMIVEYWRGQGASLAPADVTEIQRQLHVPALKGIPAAGMQRYLEMKGFSVFTFAGGWSDLGHHLARGRPLIVSLEVAPHTLHYAVVAGASDATVALNDPADRKLRQYDRADFEKKWFAAGQWTLLAVPRAQK